MNFNMKKVTNIIVFIIIILGIFLLDFVILKNTDKLVPKHENELYVIENTANSEESNSMDFFYNMLEQIYDINYKKISNNEKLNYIKENQIIYNLIDKYYNLQDSKENQTTYITTEEEHNLQDEELLKAFNYLYIGELNNTIYGDMQVICYGFFGNSKNVDYYIVYSKDMTKICYFNTNLSPIGSTYDSQSTEIYDIEDDGSHTDKNKEDIAKKGKELFDIMMPNIDFNSDTIIKQETYYILKDSSKNITIYYDEKTNTIFGFYMGFDN